MGTQYKNLTNNDISFIKKQKMFFIASCSDKEVNLSSKGYDTIRVLNNTQILFLSYPGSGNRTYRDASNNGKFTLVFTSFDETPKILRIFAKAIIIDKTHNKYEEYKNIFGIKESLIRDIFLFDIYAVELSCGESVPYYEYKGDRNSLKNWAKSMDKKEHLKCIKKIILIHLI